MGRRAREGDDQPRGRPVTPSEGGTGPTEVRIALGGIFGGAAGIVVATLVGADLSWGIWTGVAFGVLLTLLVESLFPWGRTI